MPYIVETRRAVTEEVAPGQGDPQTEAYRQLTGAPVVHECRVESSRVAVGTSGRARAAALRAIPLQPESGLRPEEWDPAWHAIFAMDDEGAEIELPDGGKVIVTRVRWDVLREQAWAAGCGVIERFPGDDGQPVLDAWNAVCGTQERTDG